MPAKIGMRAVGSRWRSSKNQAIVRPSPAVPAAPVSDRAASRAWAFGAHGFGLLGQEMGDLDRPAVFPELEVVAGEAGNREAVAVGDEHLDVGDVDLDGFVERLGGGSGLRGAGRRGGAEPGRGRKGGSGSAREISLLRNDALRRLWTIGVCLARAGWKRRGFRRGTEPSPPAPGEGKGQARRKGRYSAAQKANWLAKFWTAAWSAGPPAICSGDSSCPGAGSGANQTPSRMRVSFGQSG